MVRLVRRFTDRKPALPMATLRRARPVRNPAVEEETIPNGVVLRAPLEATGNGWLLRLARKMKLPENRTFELDALGASVWELIDGNRTFETIRDEMRRRYQMNRLEAEASLSAFLQTLGQRRLITLMTPKEKR